MSSFFLGLIFFLPFVVPLPVQGSSVYIENKAETRVSGGENSSVHSLIETTVNGETTKIESTSPGKLKLEFKKVGDASPTVTIYKEDSQATPQETTFPKTFLNFFREFFFKITRLFSLRLPS